MHPFNFQTYIKITQDNAKYLHRTLTNHYRVLYYKKKYLLGIYLKVFEYRQEGQDLDNLERHLVVPGALVVLVLQVQLLHEDVQAVVDEEPLFRVVTLRSCCCASWTHWQSSFRLPRLI